MNPQYDNVLISIIQNEGGPDKYLDIMFGFLMRRTDFFFEKQDGKGPGLPPDVARKMVLRTFDKYQRAFKRYQEEHLKATSIPGPNTRAPESTDDKNDKINDGVSNAALEPAAAAPAATKPVAAERGSKPKPQKKEIVGPGFSFTKDEHGERSYVAEPECYNGARRDQYSWSQQILELDIRVMIPERIKSVRELTVRIDKNHVFISENGAAVPIIDLDLLREVKTETATWSFEPDENVVLISLDKTDDYWWEAAFVGEEKINVQNIDASRPMQDLDEETQAKIAQMMFDQEQKRKGLPTAEEKKVQEILAGAWNKEGSPFQGQPFDPSQVAFGSGGGDQFPHPPPN